MSLGQRIALGSLAVLGLVAAAAMGVLANAIAGDSIGLSAKPLRAGDQLAPAVADRSPSAGQQAGIEPDRTQAKDSGDATTATTPPATTTEPGDDHGGAVDNSGSGSLNSGSGSSGSDSSESGSSSDD